MITKKKSAVLISFALILLLFASFSGCSLFSFLGGGESGMKLSYNIPSDKELKYSMTNESSQDMEIQSQSIQTSSNMDCSFSVKSEENLDDSQKLGVVINDIKMKVGTPQGEMNPDMNEVIGKAFKMTLTKLGKELNLEGANQLKYKLGQAGERSIASNFQSVFPDLPDKPVNVGDSWTTYDTVKINESNTNLVLVFESINTLKGIEKVNGRNCLKVEADVKGILSGTGKQMGVDLSFDGTITGKDRWHFDHEHGLLVDSESNSFTDATIKTAGMQEMTIPMTTNMKIKTALVE